MKQREIDATGKMRWDVYHRRNWMLPVYRSIMANQKEARDFRRMVCGYCTCPHPRIRTSQFFTTAIRRRVERDHEKMFNQDACATALEWKPTK